MRKSFLAGVSVCLIALVICTLVVLASPGGSMDDPTVSLSYLEGKFMDKIKTYIDGRSDMRFYVVELSAGQTLIGGSGCELILRMGTGKIIATAKGGLVDSTAGFDIQNGEAIPPNHLLIIPLDDGRGISVDTTSLVMVKGNYKIK